MYVHEMREVFQRVAVVNLARRPDRWRSFLRRLPSNWPFSPPLRFPAIDGRACQIPAFWQTGAGAWGCYQSHLTIIADCLAQGIDSILVLEDDAIFVQDFAAAAQEFLRHLPADWQFIYFGGQHIELHQGLPERVNDWVYRPVNVNRLHAYALRGRAMLQRAHDHLQHPETWKSGHQIDHHLGELHKTMKSGLYVPHRWLVAQTEGPSDISEVPQPERMFWGAEALTEPRVSARMVAVLGGFDRETSCVAGLLHTLGISLGVASPALEPSEQHTAELTYENAWLDELCSQFFAGPWLQERVPPSLRTKLLRLWAAHRCDHRPPPANLVGAKHPYLCLAGPEFAAAWNTPPVIGVDSSGDSEIQSAAARHPRWPLDAVLAATDQIRLARDLFLSRYTGPLLRVSAHDLYHRSEQFVQTLTEFLQVEAGSRELTSARGILRSLRGVRCA